MTKKQKIEIHRDEDLASIDDELDTALEKLEGANKNVLDLLETIEQQGDEALGFEYCEEDDEPARGETQEAQDETQGAPKQGTST